MATGGIVLAFIAGVVSVLGSPQRVGATGYGCGATANLSGANH
jgi:hypothetical protein